MRTPDAHEIMRLMSAETTLAPLSEPVYFVMLDERRQKPWLPLFEGAEPPPASVYWRQWDGETAWIINTYVQLKRRGLDVRLSKRLVPGGLCVLTYDDAARAGKGLLSWRSYILCCRMDRARPAYCDEVIVQNRTSADGPGVHFVPHWPQLSLRPRDEGRGDRFENVVFHGEIENIAPEFRTPEFGAALAAIGVRFVVHPLRKSRIGDAGRDWSQTDAVLAVRGGSEYFRSIKPALKLVNAWQAGCVAFVGPEAGSRDERKSELDYFEVSNASEALAAMQRLAREPGLYRAMVENGRRRALEHTPDAIARAWRETLADVIAGGYARWTEAGPFARLVAAPMTQARRYVGHKVARRRFWRLLEGRGYQAATAR
jgi:glycosyltransferase involved in cell wall biosynthesis